MDFKKKSYTRQSFSNVNVHMFVCLWKYFFPCLYISQISLSPSFSSFLPFSLFYFFNFWLALSVFSTHNNFHLSTVKTFPFYKFIKFKIFQNQIILKYKFNDFMQINFFLFKQKTRKIRKSETNFQIIEGKFIYIWNLILFFFENRFV